MKTWALLLINKMIALYGHNAYITKKAAIAHICRYQWVHRDRPLFVRELEQLKQDINDEVV